jgi:hypothetical protein
MLFFPGSSDRAELSDRMDAMQCNEHLSILLSCRGNRDSREIRKKVANHHFHPPPLFKKKRSRIALSKFVNNKHFIVPHKCGRSRPRKQRKGGAFSGSRGAGIARGLAFMGTTPISGDYPHTAVRRRSSVCKQSADFRGSEGDPIFGQRCHGAVRRQALSSLEAGKRERLGAQNQAIADRSAERIEGNSTAGP